MNTGYSWDIYEISMNLDRTRPRPTPNRVDAVNWDTLLPEMSPMLFLLANCTLMLALEAADSRKQIFFPMFAMEARARKWLGNLRVRISM